MKFWSSGSKLRSQSGKFLRFMGCAQSVVEKIEPWAILLVFLGLLLTFFSLIIDLGDRQTERIFYAWSTIHQASVLNRMDTVIDKMAESPKSQASHSSENGTSSEGKDVKILTEPNNPSNLRQAVEYLNRRHDGRICGSFVKWFSSEMFGDYSRKCVVPRKRQESFAELKADRIEFRDSNLQGIILERASLKNAIFECSTMNKADLSGANLSRAIVLDANLSRAKLSFANLSDAHLANTNLSYAQIGDADFINARLEGVNLKESTLVLSNFSGAKLLFVNFSGAEIIKVDFDAADLAYINFSDARLEDVDFNGIDLTDVNYRDSHRAGIIESGALMKSGCDSVTLENEDIMPILVSSDFSNATLTNVDFSGANATCADFSGTEFGNANMERTILKDANLSEANMSNVRGLTQHQLDEACTVGAPKIVPKGFKWAKRIKTEDPTLCNCRHLKKNMHGNASF